MGKFDYVFWQRLLVKVMLIITLILAVVFVAGIIYSYANGLFLEQGRVDNIVSDDRENTNRTVNENVIESKRDNVPNVTVDSKVNSDNVYLTINLDWRTLAAIAGLALAIITKIGKHRKKIDLPDALE